MSTRVAEETNARGSSHREAMSPSKAQPSKPQSNVVKHFLPTLMALQETQHSSLSCEPSIKMSQAPVSTSPATKLMIDEPMQGVMPQMLTISSLDIGRKATVFTMHSEV